MTLCTNALDLPKVFFNNMQRGKKQTFRKVKKNLY